MNDKREQKKPFLYTLIRAGERNADFLFKRNWDDIDDTPAGWGLHLDIGAPSPASVLIFVNRTVPADRIVHEVQQALTHFREHTEPIYEEGNESEEQEGTE